MAETDVYQARMRHSRFDGTNGMRPRKLLTQLLKIISLLEEGNMEDIDAAYNQFSRDSALYEFSMNKIQIVADTSEREVLSYRTLREELRDSMQKIAKDIEELKDRVARERVVRQHKEEYALLAKQVEQYDSRSKTQADNDAIQEELKQLEEQTHKQAEAMDLKKKQFSLLLHLAAELRKNDDESEEVNVALSAGGGDTEMKEE